jgi:hypothetical protein
LKVARPPLITAERLNLTQYLSGFSGRTTIGYPPAIILFCKTVSGSLGSLALDAKLATTGTHAELPRPEPSTMPENFIVSLLPEEFKQKGANISRIHAEELGYISNLINNLHEKNITVLLAVSFFISKISSTVWLL